LGDDSLDSGVGLLDLAIAEADEFLGTGHVRHEFVHINIFRISETSDDPRQLSHRLPIRHLVRFHGRSSFQVIWVTVLTTSPAARLVVIVSPLARSAADFTAFPWPLSVIEKPRRRT